MVPNNFFNSNWSLSLISGNVSVSPAGAGVEGAKRTLLQKDNIGLGKVGNKKVQLNILLLKQ